MADTSTPDPVAPADRTDQIQAAMDMAAFIDASPSPYHAAASAAALLDAAGFSPVDETMPFPAEHGGRYVVRGGTLVAWAVGDGQDPASGFALVGAHTDSPNLRIKPNPDSGKAGYRQLGVEVYGGVLLNSWLNRDLGLSGRVAVSGEGGIQERLLKVDRPVLQIPQLAIHLDREVNDKGLKLNAQNHLAPIWALDAPDEAEFASFCADELGVDRSAILSWDVMVHDLVPSGVTGLRQEFLSAPRIDNLASAHAATVAMAAIASESMASASGPVPVLALFDHEEVGSTSDTGASGPFLRHVLERSVLARGGDRAAFLTALARSNAISADGAHATHPNYADRHEPDHELELNAGPALKINANQRYATTSEAAARVMAAAEAAEVPLQRFVNRTDLPCGSTIGPLTAAQLGISTADLGIPQLSMHAAREICGSADPAYLVRLLRAFFS